MGLVQGQGQLADWLVGLERLEQEACVGGWPRDSPPYDIRRIRDPASLTCSLPPPTDSDTWGWQAPSESNQWAGASHSWNQQHGDRAWGGDNHEGRGDHGRNRDHEGRGGRNRDRDHGGRNWGNNDHDNND